ncbi:MAG: hypothetical protein EOP06_03225 [Proteobacteria bacterium]|nr:MAG: hypothetical protein EOP06_03225 [Pseudomonadota bacterium]
MHQYFVIILMTAFSVSALAIEKKNTKGYSCGGCESDRTTRFACLLACFPICESVNAGYVPASELNEKSITPESKPVDGCDRCKGTVITVVDELPIDGQLIKVCQPRTQK